MEYDFRIGDMKDSDKMRFVLYQDVVTKFSYSILSALALFRREFFVSKVL